MSVCPSQQLPVPGASTQVKVEEVKEVADSDRHIIIYNIIYGILYTVSIRSVTSKKSCALDGGSSCERSAKQAVSRREKIDLDLKL